MKQTKFRNLQIGESFLYNGILYTKESDTEGMNDRFGKFTIYPSETVESFYSPKFRLRRIVIAISAFTLLYLLYEYIF